MHVYEDACVDLGSGLNDERSWLSVEHIGRLKDALEAYDAAYELSKAETSWNGIMQCLIELRDYTEALERVEQYLRFSPTNQNALSMQVFLLAHLKREVEAAEAALYLL